MILYSGNEDSHNEGVGILLHDIKAEALISWKSVNDRIITTWLLTWQAKVAIIQAYVPTNVSTDDEKLEFYDHLQETLDEIPRHYIKSLSGNFSAQIDSNWEEQECTIVRHGSANTTTDNGELLI